MYKKILNSLKELNVYIQDCTILKSTRPVGNCILCEKHSSTKRHKVSVIDSFDRRFKLLVCEDCLRGLKELITFVEGK